MNVSQFVMSGDGWVQVTPCGEYPHKGAGVTQVIDRESCEKMVADFNARKAVENFPGALVDFDHFSLDTDKPSEAAGWIPELEARDDGLWARVRWSDAGLSAVTGGRYRLLSPVFRHPGGTEDLGEGRVRPVVLESVALTNEPNIKGGKPIANRQGGVGSEELGVGGNGLVNRETPGDGPGAKEGNGPIGKQNPGDVMSGPGAKKFMWLLGDPPKGPHCGDCVSRNGQVKTLLEWLRMPAPKCHCYCRLAEVGKDVPEGYDPAAVTLNLGNRWSDAARASARASRKANGWGGGGWSDAARAASLAVRREKAAARAASGGTYPDGQPVIRDLTDIGSDYTGGTFITGADPVIERQRQYEEAFREWWDGVETTSGNIDAFNEFVAAFGGMTAAAAGSSSPAGAASRAFGAGGTRTGEARARRSRDFWSIPKNIKSLADKLNPFTPTSGSPPDASAWVKAQTDFLSWRSASRASLLDAIEKARGVLTEKEKTDLNGLNESILRGYLKDIGGDPDAVAPRREVPAGPAPTFEQLKALYGVPPHKLRTPEKYQPKATPAEVREGMRDYLKEALGDRRGTVEQNLRELEVYQRLSARAVAKAKDELRDAHHATSEARRLNGASSPEYAEAQKGVEATLWDLEHVTRSNERNTAELRQLRMNLADFERQVREGNPIDWGPLDGEVNRLLEEARRSGGALGNRWKYGWGDAARAASLAVRKAKAMARKADDAFSKFLTGGLVTEEKPVQKKGVCYACGQAGHYVAECPDKAVLTPKKLAPHLNEAGDLVVDDSLTILKGTSPEQVAKILKRHAAVYILDDMIDYDQRIRAAAVRQSAENAELGVTSAQRDATWREVLAAWMSGRNGQADVAEALRALGIETEKRRKGSKKMKNNVASADRIGNRWSDSARAAARAARKANGNYGGWSDAARAAALAVRREKAAARGSLGGTYPDGQPVIRDLTDIGSDYTGGTYITDADPVAERQRQYEEAFRQWWNGVEGTADNIAKFNEYVAAFGGAAAAAAGAYNPAGAASGAFGGKYGGQKPVYNASGEVVGWAKAGGPGVAARRRSGTTGTAERTGITGDPLNNPKTASDLALRESYGRYLEDIRGQRETEMASRGLDPQGSPLSSNGGRLTESVARDAARALGALHGAYGVGEDGVDIPESLRGEYELGRVEGAKGYDYGIVPPKDRAAVLRGAQAYLDRAAGEDDGYSPDHLNDRYNLADWDSASSWATRNQGAKGIYNPSTPDTRGQYSPAGLMRTAMEWFSDAIVRGDRGESNAALSYMSDMLVALSADRNAAVEAARGGADGDEEDGPEVDATMPVYDEDGVEIGGATGGVTRPVRLRVHRARRTAGVAAGGVTRRARLRSR